MLKIFRTQWLKELRNYYNIVCVGKKRKGIRRGDKMNIEAFQREKQKKTYYKK